MAWYRVRTYNCPKCGADLASEKLDLSYARLCPSCHEQVIRSVDSVAKDWFVVFARWGFGIALAAVAVLMAVMWYRTPDATVNWLLAGLPIGIGVAFVAGFFFGAVVGIVGCIRFYWRNYSAIVQSGKASFSKLALYLGLAGILLFPLGAIALILGFIGLKKDGKNGIAIAGIVLGSLQVALSTFLILSGAAVKTGGS